MNLLILEKEKEDFTCVIKKISFASSVTIIDKRKKLEANRFPERLSELRGAMSREKFAEKVDLSAKTVERYEKSETLPNYNEFVKICLNLGISADYLMFGKSKNGNMANDEILMNLICYCTEEQKQALIDLLRVFIKVI